MSEQRYTVEEHGYCTHVPFNMVTGEAIKPVSINNRKLVEVDWNVAVVSVVRGEYDIHDLEDDQSLACGADVNAVPTLWRNVVKHALRVNKGKETRFYHEL